MPDASTFAPKNDFPIASVAQLYADRNVKEAAMRAQQQQQLVEGLKGFGAGVDSLVNRRMQMLSPLDPNIRINEADIYIAMERFAEALAIYRELLSVESSLLAKPVDDLLTTISWLIPKIQ